MIESGIDWHKQMVLGPPQYAAWGASQSTIETSTSDIQYELDTYNVVAVVSIAVHKVKYESEV